MTELPATSYDAIAYPSRCWPQTHPDRLATLATLFGMTPTSVESCRVLELGCGDGANLIAMAFSLPGSSFVGVDLAPSVISKAKEDAKSLGLSNVEFHCADLLNWSPPHGSFDYIIAHGFFSWVPEPVRQRALALCHERLAAQGVAYISYNAMPGCHIRGMMRDMMLFHTRGVSDPRQKIKKAKSFLDVLVAGRTSDDPLNGVLINEAQRLKDREAESVLFHDDLAEINQPYYFHEFAALAKKHSLQFLAEADFSDMTESGIPPDVVKELRKLDGDIVEKEQYLDFLKCRRFRQTLLCRSEISLNRELQPSVISRMLISSKARPATAQPDLRPGVVVRFSAPKISAEVGDPVVKIALVELMNISPRAMTLDALTTAVLRRMGHQGDTVGEVKDHLATAMLAGYSAGMVELHTHQFPWAAKRGRRPTLSPLARHQLQNSRLFATNLYHADVRIETAALRATLLLMDGTRNVSTIASELRKRIESFELTLPQGSSLNNLNSDVERGIQEAVANAMLVAWDDPNN